VIGGKVICQLDAAGVWLRANDPGFSLVGDQRASKVIGEKFFIGQILVPSS
jgi:hypothetical protein